MRYLVTLLAAGLVLASCKPTVADPAEAEPSRGLADPVRSFVAGSRLLKSEKSVPGRYIVVLNGQTLARAQVGPLAHQVSALHGGAVKHVYSQAFQGFAAAMTEAEALKLSNDPRVRYVEEDSELQLMGTQSNAPWGLDRIDQREQPLDGTYQYDETGTGVHVYIIDSGIRLTHSEFGGRAVPSFTTVHDGNGSNDCNGHGTHVAGTIGGATYGVAKGVTLHSVRVTDCGGGGYLSDVLAGIDWVTANHVKPAVANLSLLTSASTTLDEAVTRSINAGVTYAVSAGVGSSPTACHLSPSRVPAALTVGSVDTGDAIPFAASNFGDCVDLYAPGMNILSAWNTNDTSSNTFSGTSMATAHVAGVAALYLEGHPLATPAEVSTELTTRATPDVVGYSHQYRLLYARGNGADQAPPQVVLSSPAAGATVRGTVTLAATMTDASAIARVEFFLGERLLGVDTTAPFELDWNSATSLNGPAGLSARAYDVHYNLGMSSQVEVTLDNPGAAVFDPAWGTPVCAAVGGRCDSGRLLEGRGGTGPELHQPNTLGGSCVDGQGGTYLKSPSVERLLVFPSDGTTFQAGKEVTIQATFYVEKSPYLGTYEHLDLFGAADASNPVWTPITTFWAGHGLQTFSVKYLLPAGGLQVIRAVLVNNVAPLQNACVQNNGQWGNDHDDLVFAVGQEPDFTPPSVAITSPLEGARVNGNLVVQMEASDAFAVQRVELYQGSTLLTTDTQAPYAWTWNARTLPNGPYTLTALAYDVAGNVSQHTVNVVVDNDFTPPSEPIITAPVAGASVSGTVSIEVAASDDRQVARVDFFVDGWLIGRDTTAPFAFAWNSAGVFNGSHTLSVKAYDGAGQAAASVPITVETGNAGNARYDPVLKVPRCDTLAGRCDTRTLLEGRGTGAERNTPNTLDGCVDGTDRGVYEAIEAIRVIREDGTALAAGKRVRIEVDVYVSSFAAASFDMLQVYSAADATQPAWTPIATLYPMSPGRQTLSAEYVLPAGGLQAVRAIFDLGAGDACGASTPSSSSTDRDDLVFPVGQETDSVRPSASLTSPAPGATLTGTVTLSAVASDDFGVVAVDFFDGQTLIGTDGTDPYGVRWDTRSAANGSHTLTARARDLAGYVAASQPVTVTTDNDFTAPVVSITAPTSGTRVAGYVTLSADATDNLGVARVEFYDGPHLIGSSTASPARVSWNTASTVKGDHVLTARAYDAAGNMGISGQVSVRVVPELTPPSVSITAPANGATLVGTVTISANATDASGVSQVDFLLNGTLLGTDTSSPYSLSWDSQTAASGGHTLTVRATDIHGSIGTATVSVKVDKAAPAVALTSPASGATVGGLVVLQADATDDAGVARVDFFVDGVLLASATAAPFQVSWDSGWWANGPHVLSAKAYDAVNNLATSTEVAVTTYQPGSAVYDSVLRVPRCATLNSICDTHTLAKGRASSESNAPNTLKSCADGDYNSSTLNQVNRVKLSTVDGAPFAPGQRVRIEVQTQSNSSATLDLFAASDAKTPVWTPLARLPLGLGTHVSSTEYVLPAGFHQAVRAQLRYGSYPSPESACLTSYADDTDDVVFVAAPLGLTAPVHNAAVRGVVPVAAVAADGQAVTRVEFYADGTRFGTDTSAPFESTWDSTSVAEGAHTLAAKGYDSTGRLLGTSPSVVVNVDRTLPDAALTSPAPGSLLRDQVLLQATASDTVGVAKVEFYVDDGTLIGTDTSAPYSVTWNSWAVTSGAHTLTVKAHDGAGNVRTSPGVGVTVDNTPPSTSIDSPRANSYIRGTVPIQATVSDNHEVVRVEFYADGTLLGTDTTAPYEESWDTTTVVAGEHTLTLKAYDPAGNVGTYNARVYIDNTAPDAVLTSPAPGSLLRGSVVLEANVSDNLAVYRVEFYRGTTFIGTDTGAPWKMTWITSASGAHDGAQMLWVKAFDYAGNIQTSAGVEVTIDNTAPTTALSAPAQNAQVQGVVLVRASASDTHGVVKVEFYVDGTLLGTDTQEPYEASWDTTPVVEGAHTLTTKAYDLAGNVRSSAGVVVYADTAPPEAALTTPAPGSFLRGSVVLQATASDTVGVAKVEFYVGQTLVGTDSTSPYAVSWNTQGVVDGAQTLTVKAFDMAGNVHGSAEVGVTVDNTAPVTAFNAPAQDAHLRGTVLVRATASDTFGVERVEFHAGTTLLGTDSTSPHELSWDTQGLADGAQTLTVKAFDKAGNVATSEVGVTVDNTAPATDLSAPAQNARVRGTVPVSATASDTLGVERVEFYAGSTLLGTDATAPYAVSWDTTAWANGGVTLTTRAYDTAGNVTVSTGRAVTVDNAAPTVAITSPANGASLFLSATLQASANDNVGVTQVVFYDGATVIGTDTTAPYSVSWNLLAVSKGTHTLTAKAHDAAGNVTTSAPVSVKVN